MRVYALYVLVAALAVYAWKDWFKSLCGLILLMAVIEHGDMPKSMFGIQGFNPWNVLLLSILLAWLASRRRENLLWDMPNHVTVLLMLFVLTILVGFFRAVLDRTHIEHLPLKSLVSEHLINTVKWIIPALLVFDGCRSRKRAVLVIGSLLIMYFVLGALVVKRLPVRCVMEESKQVDRIRLKICQRTGYSRCDMSTILAGASWAMLATVGLLRRKVHKVLVFGAAGLTAFGQALTGGRAGYLAWAATGFVLCLIRWRKGLLLVPVLPFVLFALFPGAAERCLRGFGETDVAGGTTVNAEVLTADRAVVWPYVIGEIGKAPILGHGRLAMQRTGLQHRITQEHGRGTAVAHPHNVYLEWLLDNGVLGFAVVIALFSVILYDAAKLFRASDPLLSAVGGIGLSLVLAQLFAGIGAQHFYPREGSLGMWVAIMLVFRATVAANPAWRRTMIRSSGTPAPPFGRLGSSVVR